MRGLWFIENDRRTGHQRNDSPRPAIRGTSSAQWMMITIDAVTGETLPRGHTLLARTNRRLGETRAVRALPVLRRRSCCAQLLAEAPAGRVNLSDDICYPNEHLGGLKGASSSHVIGWSSGQCSRQADGG